MTRGKRTQTQDLQVQLLREGIVESVHHVQAVVCDGRGRVLLAAGNSETATFIRSALKPFQALAVTSTGTMEWFRLSDKDLAIMCSSHRGRIEQARQAFHILWRADVNPKDLQCPIPPGKRSPLEHNCSGKHAGMLATGRRRPDGAEPTFSDGLSARLSCGKRSSRSRFSARRASYSACPSMRSSVWRRPA